MIAMSLALEPSLIIADQPTTALDVTTQTQILSLLKELQGKHGTAILFITHDLRVAAHVCETIVVMCQDEIVERGSTAEIFANPQHEYTCQLPKSVPGKQWEH